VVWPSRLHSILHSTLAHSVIARYHQILSRHSVQKSATVRYIGNSTEHHKPIAWVLSHRLDHTLTIQDLRRDYTYGSLSRADLPNDPMEMFRNWFAQLQTMPLPPWFEVNAMTLSSNRSDGSTASRIVLLKGIENDCMLFFTNYNSEKGHQIEHDQRVALNFYWPILDRQVRVEGRASKTSAAVSDRYFASRPRGSQLGAVASPQSQVLADHWQLEREIQMLDEQLKDKPVPRPENWGGYSVEPSTIEFWQGRPSRLHDRFRYRKQTNGNWFIERLAP
jgi:pyridoxamine 5'-phosphate oxidase